MKFYNYLNEYEKRKSVFDSSISVAILNKNDSEYKIWEKKFKIYGIAIGIPKEKIIIWDGEQLKKLTKDQKLFVEAHEYSHFIIGAKASELDCDYLAILNLFKMGNKKAAQVGINSFFDRHKIKFDMNKLKEYEKYI
jgi:hypothetical protein